MIKISLPGSIATFQVENINDMEDIKQMLSLENYQVNDCYFFVDAHYWQGVAYQLQEEGYKLVHDGKELVIEPR